MRPARDPLAELSKSADLCLALAVAAIAAVTIWTTWFVCNGFFMGLEEPK